MIARKIILIVGSRKDPHVRGVRDDLLCLGAQPIILDRYSTSDTLTINPKSNSIVIEAVEGTVDCRDLTGAWWRLKPMESWNPSIAADQVAREFAAREWTSTLFSLPFLVDWVKWVNPFPAHITASYKPLQLKLAHDIGLSIPETIISNSFNHVCREVTNHRESIYKQLSGFRFPPDQFIFTNKISNADLCGEEESIRRCQSIFQELIAKKVEWRITVIGDNVFSVRIESQKFDDTKVDWRRAQLANMYAADRLPADLEMRILDLHKQLGLTYGAYDLIESITGDAIFLECNPGGQWAWLENATGLPITRSLAAQLLSS
jgi:hypothetical protein